jgi:hypothetical protein
MNFDEWWNTLSPAEQKVIGRHNASFVWTQCKGEWVGLTDDEYQNILKQTEGCGHLAFYNLVESKLREKNYGSAAG